MKFGYIKLPVLEHTLNVYKLLHIDIESNIYMNIRIDKIEYFHGSHTDHMKNNRSAIRIMSYPNTYVIFVAESFYNILHEDVITYIQDSDLVSYNFIHFISILDEYLERLHYMLNEYLLICQYELDL